jgi:hypothetical protein
MSERSIVTKRISASGPPTPFPKEPIRSLDDTSSIKARKRSVQSAGTTRSAKDTETKEFPKHRRVQSAIDKRQAVNYSSNETPYGNNDWAKTSYSLDFTKKKPIALPKVRPASATRMHNPQPSQMFLKWRIPTRIHPHDKAVHPNPKVFSDIQEKFYEDYSSNLIPGEAKYEVPITNLAKIPFPGLDMPLSVKGTAVGGRGNEDKLSFDQVLMPQTCNVIEEWMQSASDKEKRVFGKMLRAAHINNSTTTKMIGEVFNPDSMKQIQTWLQSAGNEDLTIAMEILKNLSKKTHQYKIQHTNKKHKPHLYTWPKQKSSSQDHSDLGIKGVSAFRPHSADRCSHCSKSDVQSIYKNLRNEKDKTWKSVPIAATWNHRINPPRKAKLLNGGSVFNLPHKPRGDHFAIHPEWPTA